MSTVSDLIKGSLRLIGAIAAGETPTSAELSDGLVSLNDTLETWSNDGLMIYSKVRETLSVVSGTQTYSIGSGADFDTTRPQIINSAAIVLSSGEPEIPLDIFNEQQWASIQLKTTQSNLPTVLYYNPTYPNGEMNLWPKPNASSTLVLYSTKPLSSFATTGATVSLPPGYSEALRYNLALRLAPEFGKMPSELVVMTARQSKEAIQRKNVKPAFVTSDVMGLVGNRNFNWKTGE